MEPESDKGVGRAFRLRRKNLNAKTPRREVQGPVKSEQIETSRSNAPLAGTGEERHRCGFVSSRLWVAVLSRVLSAISKHERQVLPQRNRAEVAGPLG